jgi:hypothetical protein
MRIGWNWGGANVIDLGFLRPDETSASEEQRKSSLENPP